MDYLNLLQNHIDRDVDIIVSCVPVGESGAPDFGLLKFDNKGKVIQFPEKPKGEDLQANVMALIAYLMEFKSNCGPHLIIVPNVVLVNWKSELHSWLPNVSCIYYVGNKDQRAKLFSQEVCALKFNVLVTAYEFIMFDRSKLSRVDWKYIIIDEAQRMKDRESVLAHDLDKYRCQRRFLLTGTPLQVWGRSRQ